MSTQEQNTPRPHRSKILEKLLSEITPEQQAKIDAEMLAMCEQNTPTPREFGFYWVKYQNSWTLAERTPEFDSEHIWYIIGSGGAYVESDFEEIVRFESKHP